MHAYLILTDELWAVYCEYFGEVLSRHHTETSLIFQILLCWCCMYEWWYQWPPTWLSGNRWYVSSAILHIDGLVQDCSNSIANALELLQSRTKPSIWLYSRVMNHDISYNMAIAKIGYRIHYKFIKGHHVDHMPSWVNYGVSIVSTMKTFFSLLLNHTLPSLVFQTFL